MDAVRLKKIACEWIDKAAQDLNSLSQDIWNHPELCYQEKYSHDALCTFLEKYGFQVERHYTLDTAFKASMGEKEVRFDFCGVSRIARNMGAIVFMFIRYLYYIG